MTILSDRQIKALCLAPETFFDAAGYERWMAEQLPVPTCKTAVSGYWEEMRKTFEHPATQAQKDLFVPMIAPFEATSVKEITEVSSDVKKKFKTLSFGSSSYGYDVRLGYEFKIFTNVRGGEIDPKKISNDCLIDGILRKADDGSCYVILPPNSYLLGVTIEHFNMPRDVMAICVGKSTYARAGVGINVTPIEPGFKGTVVIEIANWTSLPVRIYAGEGIAQMVLFQGTEPCETSYADRSGKYQNQWGIQLGKV